MGQDAEMLIESKANGRTVVASGVAILLAGETAWDLSIEDLSYRFTFAPTIGDPRAEHVGTIAKHAEMKITGGAGSFGIGIHLPGIALLGGVPHHLSFFVNIAGTGDLLMRSISYSISQ